LAFSNYNQIFRIINHIERVEMPSYNHHTDIQNRNKDLREKYLIKEINEDKFKTMLQRRFKRENFEIEIYQMLEMFSTVLKEFFTDFFRNLDNSTKTKMLTIFSRRFNIRAINNFRYPDSTSFVDKLKNLQIYFKNNVEKICDKYAYSVPKWEILDDKCFKFIP
jgi:hypothetical protein